METLEFKKKIINLLKEDEEFRLAIAGLLGLDTTLNEIRKLRENFNKFIKLETKRWKENSKRWEENNKRWEENNKKWEENNKRWEENNKRWEENNKRWEENDKKWEEAYKRFEAIETELKKLREDFNKSYTSIMRRMDSFERKLIALGARWGIESEEAFREAMKGVIEELFGAGRVEKWIYYDEKGEIFGYPSQIEVDVLIRDNIHILVEIKSSTSDGDVIKLWRIGNLYLKATGIKPILAIVTPFIDQRGLEVAKKLGIEIFTNT